VALILEVALAIISGRGGMADTKSRTYSLFSLSLFLSLFIFLLSLLFSIVLYKYVSRWVYPLLWMLFIAFLGESVMNVMGFYWVWGASTHCVVMRAELVTALKVPNYMMLNILLEGNTY